MGNRQGRAPPSVAVSVPRKTLPTLLPILPEVPVQRIMYGWYYTYVRRCNMHNTFKLHPCTTTMAFEMKHGIMGNGPILLWLNIGLNQILVVIKVGYHCQFLC